MFHTTPNRLEPHNIELPLGSHILVQPQWLHLTALYLRHWYPALHPHHHHISDQIQVLRPVGWRIVVIHIATRRIWMGRTVFLNAVAISRRQPQHLREFQPELLRL